MQETVAETLEETGAVVPDGAEVQAAPVAMPPEEEAAMKFTKLLPFVTKLGDAMPSKGGLVRVMRALAEFPIGGREPRLLNDSERQLFHVMMELQGYKTTVVSNIMKQNAELEKLKQDATANDAVQT